MFGRNFDGTFNLVAVDGRISVDWRNDPVNPTRGSYWDMAVRQSLPFTSDDYAYTDVSAEVRGFVPLRILETVPVLKLVRKYTALLNPQMVEAGLLVFVEIDLLRTSPDVFREFRKEASRLPEVLDCHLVSGNFDYLIKARVNDMQEYRELLGEKILSLPGVSGSRSYVVMEEVKETTALPLFK